MGTLHPSQGPRDDAPHSERNVHAALHDGLPEGWRAWHSLRVRDRRKLTCEADLVVAAPDLGMLALEVKGGRVRLDDGRWHQDGRRLEKAPLRQPETAMQELAREMARRGRSTPEFRDPVVGFHPAPPVTS